MLNKTALTLALFSLFLSSSAFAESASVHAQSQPGQNPKGVEEEELCQDLCEEEDLWGLWIDIGLWWVLAQSYGIGARYGFQAAHLRVFSTYDFHLFGTTPNTDLHDIALLYGVIYSGDWANLSLTAGPAYTEVSTENNYYGYDTLSCLGLGWDASASFTIADALGLGIKIAGNENSHYSDYSGMLMLQAGDLH